MSTNLFHQSRISCLLVPRVFTMGDVLLQASKAIRATSVLQLRVCSKEHVLPTEIFHASPSASFVSDTHK